jgi:hypothetical protein
LIGIAVPTISVPVMISWLIFDLDFDDGGVAYFLDGGTLHSSCWRDASFVSTEI